MAGHRVGARLSRAARQRLTSRTSGCSTRASPRGAAAARWRRRWRPPASPRTPSLRSSRDSARCPSRSARRARRAAALTGSRTGRATNSPLVPFPETLRKRAPATVVLARGAVHCARVERSRDVTRASRRACRRARGVGPRRRGGARWLHRARARGRVLRRGAFGPRRRRRPRLGRGRDHARGGATQAVHARAFGRVPSRRRRMRTRRARRERAAVLRALLRRRRRRRRRRQGGPAFAARARRRRRARRFFSRVFFFAGAFARRRAARVSLRGARHGGCRAPDPRRARARRAGRRGLRDGRVRGLGSGHGPVVRPPPGAWGAQSAAATAGRQFAHSAITALCFLSDAGAEEEEGFQDSHARPSNALVLGGTRAAASPPGTSSRARACSPIPGATPGR